MDIPSTSDTQTEAQKAIINKCDALKAMLLEKNAAYGNSALDPVRIFSKSAVDEQLRVRLDDKISRLVRGEAAGEDPILDLTGYLILLMIAEDQAKAKPVKAAIFDKEK